MGSKQSYLQILPEGACKKVLLVTVAPPAFPQHQEAVAELAAWICSEPAGLTKEQVLARRRRMSAVDIQ